MADPITLPLTPAQLAKFRELVQGRNQINDRITALAEVIALGTYTAEQIAGQHLEVTDAGLVLTVNE